MMSAKPTRSCSVNRKFCQHVELAPRPWPCSACWTSHSLTYLVRYMSDYALRKHFAVSPHLAQNRGHARLGAIDVTELLVCNRSPVFSLNRSNRSTILAVMSFAQEVVESILSATKTDHAQSLGIVHLSLSSGLSVPRRKLDQHISAHDLEWHQLYSGYLIILLLCCHTLENTPW